MMGTRVIPGSRSAGAGSAIVEAASERVTRLGGGPRETAAADCLVAESFRMPEPNTDRNSYGLPCPWISDRKIAARFSGRLPTTRCGEDDRRLLYFSNGFWFLSSRSITHADRDSDHKLARLRRGFARSPYSPQRSSTICRAIAATIGVTSTVCAITIAAGVKRSPRFPKGPERDSRT